MPRSTTTVIKSGTYYGRWKVLKEEPKDRFGKRRFLVQCMCGYEAVRDMTALRGKRTISCLNCAREDRKVSSRSNNA